MKDLLRRLLLDHVDDVVRHQRADKAAAVVGHGGRDEIVLVEAPGDVGLLVGGAEHRLLVVHDSVHPLFRRLAQQARHGNGADEVKADVDHIDLDELVGQPFLRADVVGGLAHGP